MSFCATPNPRPTPAQPKITVPNPPPNLCPTPCPTPAQPLPNRGAQPPPPKGGGYKASRPQAYGSSHSVLSEEIAALARRVRSLSISHREPERFHEEKSDIEHQLQSIARSIKSKSPKG